MARGRMLNKTVSASMKFHQLSDDTCRLLATWIIPHLDKNGVYYGEAALVRSYIFPMRDDIGIDRTEGYLLELEQVGLMHRYKANGRIWQHWPGFDDNQVGLRKDREGTDFPNPPSDSQGIAGDLPDDCRSDAGDLPAESNGSEGKSNSNGKETYGAGAPTNLEGWLSLVDNPPDGSNSTAVLVRQFQSLFPGRDPPDYGYMGKSAKTVGGPGRMAQLLWMTSAQRVTGDPLRYAMGIAKGQKTRDGPTQNIPELEAFQ